ncbi:inner membrane protein CreD [Klebsiella pneumoniae]|nr:inner membrane protein CreD [Klebsiella pneumoniae]
MPAALVPSMPRRSTGNVLSVEPGLGISGDGAGIHMPMPAQAEDNKPLEIAFSLDLNGTGEFSLVPLGRNSELQLTSNWPHPGFLAASCQLNGK